MTRSQAAPPDTDELARRFTESAMAGDGLVLRNDAFDAWFAERLALYRHKVERVPFSDLVGWYFHPETGDLMHESGRFFSTIGLRVDSDRPANPTTMQPILNQPEIGLLGIIAKEFGGLLHFLMQAKTEPGNINTVQLSPTVQATRSNYTGVHRGRSIPYIEYFGQDRNSRVLVDGLQSEQGSWFLAKRNRNMIVEVTGDIETRADFCWLTLGQLNALLRRDNVVNMNTRSILALLPYAAPDGPADDDYRGALLRSLTPAQGAYRPLQEALTRLTEAKARNEVIRTRIPLAAVERWHRSDEEIFHEEGRYFKIIAVDVTAAHREVGHWTQPLLAPCQGGLSAFLMRRIDGVLHLLTQTRVEAGLIDLAELSPTVTYTPLNYEGMPDEDRRLHYLDCVRSAPPEWIRYDTIQSEEGGRFHHAQNRYMLIEVPDDFPLDAPDGFAWISTHQVMTLLRFSYHLNIQARTLIAALHTTW
jgi:dTDP-4-dehydro-6-deoxy-alpha-D-glucopyranose 2,3-dehydratase